MSRLEDEEKPEELHEDNKTNSEAEKCREDMTPPDTSKKKEGVTSSFSSATGEDTLDNGDTAHDKVASS